MSAMPGGLGDEPEPNPRSGSPVKTPQKQTLDAYIDLKIAEYNNNDEDNDVLWGRYTEDFQTWNKESFLAANRTKVVKLRTCLREHGVRVEMDRKKAKMPAALAQIMQEEEPAE